MFNIVLVEPRIPQNTGTIGRMALATDATLHIIEPMGFVISDKYLKRAGMDYWKDIKLKIWSDIESFWKEHPFNERHFLATTKSDNYYFEKNYNIGDYLYFGREDKGLPEEFIKKYYNQTVNIPMLNNARSINIANAVSIVIYEAIKQNISDFKN